MMASTPQSTDAAASRSGSKRKPNRLVDAVNFFRNERSETKVKGNEALVKALTTIEDTAKDKGLTEENITVLLDVAASGRFAQTTCQRLVKALIPRDHVENEAVLKAISWMSTNQPSIAMQSLLMRWILLIYDSIDNMKPLHSVYGILFYFLENETLCPHVCHLLYLLTNKEDVKLFRVQKLLALQQKMGPQPYIMGLLSIYKLYCPNLVAIVIPRSRTVYFRQTDRMWMTAIRKVKDSQKENRTINDSVDVARLSERSPSSEPRMKRTRYQLVPGISTVASNKTNVREHIPTSLDVSTPVPFEQIKSFKDLLKSLNNIELPSQIGSSLDNHLLQHVVSVSCDRVVAMRLSFWLHSILHEEFLVNPDDKTIEKREQFLELLLKFADFLQEGIPICEIFLIHFLHTWNGRDFQPYIFKLVTKFRLYSFEVLNDLVFEPLRKLYFCSSVYFKCQVTVCFTELLQNLVLFELPRYKESLSYQQDQLTRTTSPSNSSKNLCCVFVEDVKECQPSLTLIEMIEFVDDISAVGLQQEGNNTLLLNYVLDFFQLVSKLYIHFGASFVKIPSPSIVYRALFSSDALSVSKLGTIMCNYRNAFGKLKQSNLSDEMQGLGDNLGVSQIPKLNTYIKDLCNSLWRNKTFMPRENRSDSVFDDNIVKDLKMPNLNYVFSSTNHQAFLPFSLSFLEETQPDVSKRKLHMISKSHKTVYLDYLQRENLFGFKEFISNYIRPSQNRSNVTNETATTT